MVGECLFQVEVKEFTSSKPAKRLRKEIDDKAQKLPSTQHQPVVFHVVLRENGFFEKDREDTFFEAVSNLEGDLPQGISAIVAGRRFVDPKGGRVKRDVERVVINTAATAPVTEADLRVAFEANYDETEYPVYGIGSFFVFGNKQVSNE